MGEPACRGRAAAARRPRRLRQLPIANAILARLKDTFDDELPADRGASFLPVAGDEQPDGSMYWAGADTVLGPLLEADGA